MDYGSSSVRDSMQKSRGKGGFASSMVDSAGEPDQIPDYLRTSNRIQLKRHVTSSRIHNFKNKSLEATQRQQSHRNFHPTSEKLSMITTQNTLCDFNSAVKRQELFSKQPATQADYDSTMDGCFGNPHIHESPKAPLSIDEVLQHSNQDFMKKMRESYAKRVVEENKDAESDDA